MTGNFLIDSAISLGAIAVMVFVAWFFFRAPAQSVNEAAARDRLSFDEPDFAPVDWLFDEDGRAALVEGMAGEFALVFRVGGDLATRRFSPGDVGALADKDGLIVRFSDPSVGPLRLRSGGAALWAHKIAGK